MQRTLEVNTNMVTARPTYENSEDGFEEESTAIVEGAMAMLRATGDSVVA